MWIRSQSLLLLVDCSCLWVNELDIYGLSSDGEEVRLGSYANKKELLFVFDDISTFICNNCLDSGHVCGIYVMPHKSSFDFI